MNGDALTVGTGGLKKLGARARIARLKKRLRKNTIQLLSKPDFEVVNKLYAKNYIHSIFSGINEAVN
jgi:hypothetical protein